MFHITITNKRTGETIVDRDTCCIIGATDAGEGTGIMVLCHSGAKDRLATIAGALEAANGTLQREPKKAQRLIRKAVKAELKKQKITNK